MTRTPPHNPQMEANFLGLALFMPDARALLVEALDAEDFYVPRHQRIYEAIAARHVARDAVDPDLVACDLGLDAQPLREMAADGSVIQTRHASAHAEALARLAAARRMITFTEELVEAAYDGDLDAVEDRVDSADWRYSPRVRAESTLTDGLDLIAEEHAFDYVLPDLLARQEVVMWVGEPGAGKSTLLRQMAVCAASGLHPFVRTDITPIRVLLVDAQDTRMTAAHSLRPLLRLAGDRYRRGRLMVEVQPQGLDLTTTRDQRWLNRAVEKSRADLVILGPLYNLVRGNGQRTKQSEETAELAMDALTDLMARHNCAVMIEAHAPHGHELRVRGSKLWEDWPDFGYGLDAKWVDGRRSFTVVPFRGDRHWRTWPNGYEQGHADHWPWEAV